jgi:hypothetical protein
MKIYAPLAMAALLAITSGCISLSFGGRRPPAEIVPPPAQYVAPSQPLTPAEAATISEIDAASRLGFDSARQQALLQVAERSALTPVLQVHLVNVGYRCLKFESAKVALLRKVIAHPAFSDAARQAIVTQLNHLSFDSNRQHILHELNQRVTST